MFSGCAGLTSFTGDLPKLANGKSMFGDCSSLTSFSGDLLNLTNGENMFFYCSKLTSFSGDLSNLAGTSATSGGGYRMFYGCTNLTTFNSPLPSLAYARDMFYNCTSLTTFNSTLPALADGQDMFSGCILNEGSVIRILDSIPTHTDGKIHFLHLGKRTNYQTSDTVAAKLRTYTGGTVSTPIPAARDYRCVDDDGNDKGWTITVQA